MLLLLNDVTKSCLNTIEELAYWVSRPQIHQAINNKQIKKQSIWLPKPFAINNICQLYAEAFPEEQFFFKPGEEHRADAFVLLCNQCWVKASPFAVLYGLKCSRCRMNIFATPEIKGCKRNLSETIHCLLRFFFSIWKYSQRFVSTNEAAGYKEWWTGKLLQCFSNICLSKTYSLNFFHPWLSFHVPRMCRFSCQILWWILLLGLWVSKYLKHVWIRCMKHN